MNNEHISCAECKARTLSIFHVCSMDQTDKMDQVKECMMLKKGQEIFSEGRRANGIFCINHGSIKLVKLGDGGKEKIVRLAAPGDLIGYKAVVTNSSYSASAVAMEDSKMCFIPRGDFMDLLGSNERLSQEFTQLLCRNISEYESGMVDIAYKSVRKRLAEALLLLQEKFHLQEQISISRNDLATLIGTAKETTIRLLSEFKDSHIIETKGRSIVIINKDALIDISGLLD